MKFNFKHSYRWVTSSEREYTDVTIFVNGNKQAWRSFNFDSRYNQKTGWTDDDFLRAPFTEQIFDLNVKALDIIEIKTDLNVRTKFNNFKVCFDYEYFQPGHFID